MAEVRPVGNVTLTPRLIVSGALFVLAFSTLVTIIGALDLQLPVAPVVHRGGANLAPINTAALVPGYGALWGSWVAPAGGQSSAQAVAAFESTVQRRLDIVHQYHAWNDVWPTSTEYTWAAGGRIIFGNASPREASGAVLSWTAIADGSQDSVINGLAARLRAFGHRLFFSFDEEPEDRYHSNPSIYTLASFVAAYQHIHNLFVADGATNVVWVWNVSGYSGDDSIYPALYPGDGYVDWVGWDPYNWFNCAVNTTNVWQSFDTIVAPFYNWVSAGRLSAGSAIKPYMLAEYGTVENTSSPTKGQWFTSEVSDLPYRPKIKAVVYFNQDKDCNWPITTSATSISGFRTAGLSCYVDRSVPCPAVTRPTPRAAALPSHPASPAHSSPSPSPSPRSTASTPPPESPTPPGTLPFTAASLARSSDRLTNWMLAHAYLVPIVLVVLVDGGLGAQHFTSRGGPR